MAESQLNPQQEQFCSEYVIDFNGTQAAIRAGYSENTAASQASRLLTNVNISLRVKELTQQVHERALVSAEYVISGIKEVAERCLQKQAVREWDYEDKEMKQVKDENGNNVWTFDSQGANKAFEMLGKHTGVFEKDNSQKKNPSEILIIQGQKFADKA